LAVNPVGQVTDPLLEPLEVEPELVEPVLVEPLEVEPVLEPLVQQTSPLLQGTLLLLSEVSETPEQVAMVLHVPSFPVFKPTHGLPVTPLLEPLDVEPELVDPLEVELLPELEPLLVEPLEVEPEPVELPVEPVAQQVSPVA
jgi:hypothetical protein